MYDKALELDGLFVKVELDHIEVTTSPSSKVEVDCSKLLDGHSAVWSQDSRVWVVDLVVIGVDDIGVGFGVFFKFLNSL